MAKKLRKQSKSTQFGQIGQKRRKRNAIGIEGKGEFDQYDRMLRYEHTICFICLEKRGTLTSTGRCVCNRCRREHGYS